MFYNIDLDHTEQELHTFTFLSQRRLCAAPADEMETRQWNINNRWRLVSEPRRLSVPLFSQYGSVRATHTGCPLANKTAQISRMLIWCCPERTLQQIGPRMSLFIWLHDDRNASEQQDSALLPTWLIAEPKEWESRLIYGRGEKAPPLLSFRPLLTCVCVKMFALDKCFEHCIALINSTGWH